MSFLNNRVIAILITLAVFQSSTQTFMGPEFDVFVTTYNVDAMFTQSDFPSPFKEDHNEAVRIQNAAKALGKMIVGPDSTRRPLMMVLQFQEVVTCAGQKGFWSNLKISDKAGMLDENPAQGANTKEKWLIYFVVELKKNINQAIEAENAVRRTSSPKKTDLPAFPNLFSYYLSFGPLGTLVLYNQADPTRFTIHDTHRVRFGETPLFTVFGFKGGQVTTIKFESADRPNLVFFNFHISSKSLEARRIQFQKIIRESLTKYFAFETSGRDTVFFFSGDFNTRMGSNFQNVPDSDFHDTKKNIVAKEIQTNCYASYNLMLKESNHELDRAFKFLTQSAGGSYGSDNAMDCGSAYLALLEVDEYKLWFESTPKLLEKLALCKGQTIPTVVEDASKGSLGVLSKIQEAVPAYLPTFCFDRVKGQFGCEHHKAKEITSQTDRIFWATHRHSKGITKKAKPWKVQALESLAHTAWFASDHGPVAGHYRVLQDAANTEYTDGKAYVPESFISTKCEAYMKTMFDKSTMKLANAAWDTAKKNARETRKHHYASNKLLL